MIAMHNDDVNSGEEDIFIVDIIIMALEFERRVLITTLFIQERG